MGYTTDFEGYLEPNREFTNEEIKIITDFNHKRHEDSNFPGIWCQWTIENGVLEWDEGEKFYNYVEWLKYLIDNFFEKWGIKLNGTIKWKGENMNDIGKIVVENNKVTVIEFEF